MQNPVKFVLETSYEIIHKVGGVETVVRSKAPEMKRVFKDNFLMLGPFIPSDERYATQFEDCRSSNKEMDAILEGCEKTFGLPAKCLRFGNWLTSGEPRCVLLPVTGLETCERYNQIKAKAVDRLNRLLSLDLNAERDAPGQEQYKQNAVNFGVMQWLFISYLLPEVIAKRQEQTVLIYQTHEWLASFGHLLMTEGAAQLALGMPLGYYKSDAYKSAFTTHATTLGRHLSAGDQCLNDLFKMRPTEQWCAEEAAKRGIKLEHTAERLAAQRATVLTTVSVTTGQECKFFLGRQPDTITWNGLHVNSQKGLVDDNELQSTHRSMRQKIMEFVQTYFYGIDIDNCQIVFTAGRNEYKNKGIDLLIDALAKVRDELDGNTANQPEELRKKTVVAFIIAPQENDGFNEHCLKCASLSKELQLTAEQLTQQMTQNLIKKLCQPKADPKALQLADLVSRNDMITLKRFQQQIAKAGEKHPITTHRVRDDNCPILNHLRSKQLLNQPFTRVKVIFVPEFLQRTSLFGLDYADFIRGAHLGVFASLYEPFGYTSPECMCCGTASIVSNLCGFGNLVEETKRALENSGPASPIERMEKMHRESSHNLSELMQMQEHNVVSAPPKTNPWTDNPLGVNVVDRIFVGYNESVNQLSGWILDYLKLNIYDRVTLRNTMARNSVFVDWSVQVQQYVTAYDIAVTK